MHYKNPNKKTVIHDLGCLKYAEAWAYQKRILSEVVASKIPIMKALKAGRHDFTAPLNHLIFCEHPHVYTLGKSGKNNHLLVSEQELKSHKIDYFRTDRGGDITYHGPGQIVGYPIFDLYNFFSDIHRYLRALEEVIIRTLADYKLEGTRIKGLTGVWLNDKGQPRKICAMGIKASRWITMHGFAFNVSPDLTYFERIVPCGITGKAVTSLSKELNQKIDSKEVKSKVIKYIRNVFDLEILDEAV